MNIEVIRNRGQLLRKTPFIERDDKQAQNRTFELALSVRPAILAERGKPRGVSIYYRGAFIVLTEAAALTLSDQIVDALEMEINA